MKCEHQTVCQLKNTGRDEDCDSDRNDCRYFQTPFSPLSGPDCWKDVREKIENRINEYSLVQGDVDLDMKVEISTLKWVLSLLPPSGKGGE